MSSTDTPSEGPRKPEAPRKPEERHPDRTREERGRSAAPASQETPLTQQLGRVFVAVIAVLFGIFAVVNSQFVDFDWIFGETQVVEEGGERTSGGVPLIILLVTSFVLGALAGWFATWRRGRHGRDAGKPTAP